ncbi:MAG: leucine--tRNA ligase [Candidatus Marinimicrobia bacterium]|nr:leucine--tRNA ligase [Candidatus Neomarinimicrobiota bacterium]|tara:strand:- start:603 stop:2987 length:2385 start_codon:yes stop_codon:yes gene_type:complete
MEFKPQNIEKKWQKAWNDDKKSSFNIKNVKDKKYCLTMFSYPSGDKLHIGHWYNYGPADTFCRYLKMNGYNVFQPQGFDAFGLPAENYAIKHGVHPRESTEKNINTMKDQLKAIGAMYNWENEVITCQESYYKWTQWLFLELYKNNLAYQKEATVNWDPIDQTVLANEQVLSDGTSDRSGALVEQKLLKQWFLKITDYADELLDFSSLNWPKKTVRMQQNWIGRSRGAIIEFSINDFNDKISVFTTRPDTLFGATYMVLAPEHPLVESITSSEKSESVFDYIKDSKNKNELQRMDLDREKTGVFTGAYVINPVNDKKMPIWVADYVLMGYGTGAIMAVPGHDQRDYEFAKKFDLEILQVVNNESNETLDNQAITGDGVCVNSDFINDLSTQDAKNVMIDWLEKNKYGKKSINFRLRDWLISRQRYWGTPIPIVYDPDGKAHPIPEEHLPWTLPDDVEYKPKGTSPLGSSKELIDRTEKIFGKGWKPEIDTMDTFMCSSWYYLRYPDSDNKDNPFTLESNKWLPVDHYIGGAEHATMHLLYARFITKALRDLGHLSFDEPFIHLFHQGTITKDSSKMSKSKGNTVSPDQFVDKYGSDTFRCYLMFMGPYEEGGDWNDKGITGIHRFLNRSWKLCINEKDYNLTKDDEYILNNTIKSVTENLSDMKFNTAISRLMEFVNYFLKKGLNKKEMNIFIQLLSPFAPHLGEELWNRNNNSSVFSSDWPAYNSEKLDKSSMNIAIQINGKLRGTIEVDLDTEKDKILSLCKDNTNVKLHLDKKEIIKEIYVPKKLVNFVIK